MATDFSELALDAATVRTQLQNLGINDLLYTDDQLESLMTVSDIILQHSITGKAEEVEELLVNFQLKADVLNGLNEMFVYLNEQISPEAATAQAIINFLEYEQTVVATGNTADLALDYTLSANGFTGSAAYDSILDYITAVENNAATGVTDGVSDAMLYVEYQNAMDSGLFDDIYYPYGTGGATFDEFLAGNAYLGVAQSDSDAPITVLDLQGFKDYLIASALQAADYIGSDVVLDPILFVDTGTDYQLDLADNDALEWAAWNQLYFGRVNIEYDIDTEALVIGYNGAAALREMGLDPADYFGDTIVVSYEVEYEYTNQDSDIGIDTMTVEHEFDDISSRLPSRFPDGDDSLFVLLTAMSVYGDFDDLVDVSEADLEVDVMDALDGKVFAFGERRTLQDILSFESLDSEWTAMSTRDLTVAGFVDGDQVQSLIEDVTSALQSLAATSEITMLEASTALTEWGELHNGWDTIHKYVTDAIGRALRLMK